TRARLPTSSLRLLGSAGVRTSDTRNPARHFATGCSSRISPYLGLTLNEGKRQQLLIRPQRTGNSRLPDSQAPIRSPIRTVIRTPIRRGDSMERTRPQRQDEASGFRPDVPDGPNGSDPAATMEAHDTALAVPA